MSLGIHHPDVLKALGVSEEWVIDASVWSMRQIVGEECICLGDSSLCERCEDIRCLMQSVMLWRAHIVC